MGGSVNNQAAAPNFQSTQAPVDPGVMQFAKQQFAGEDMAGRDQYQAELINQLRANSFQNPESVWGAVQANQKSAADAQQAQQMQQLNEFIATAPDERAAWSPVVGYNGGDDGSSMYGAPMTIEQLRAAGKKPEGEGQWQQYVFSPGGDSGGSFYAPYFDSSGSWASGDGG